MLLALSLLTALAQPLAFAEGETPPVLDPNDPQRTLAPYFFVEDSPDGVETFPLESTRVSANVSGVIADVTVEQVYRNDGVVPINAGYVFPASTRAAVHGMQMQVGTRRVVAKIKQREQAAREFEAAKAEGKIASLLEQDRPNVFTMSIGNVMPGDRVQVSLQYSELLVPTEGLYQFVFPTVVGPRLFARSALGTLLFAAYALIFAACFCAPASRSPCSEASLTGTRGSDDERECDDERDHDHDHEDDHD